MTITHRKLVVDATRTGKFFQGPVAKPLEPYIVQHIVRITHQSPTLDISKPHGSNLHHWWKPPFAAPYGAFWLQFITRRFYKSRTNCEQIRRKKRQKAEHKLYISLKQQAFATSVQSNITSNNELNPKFVLEVCVAHGTISRSTW